MTTGSVGQGPLRGIVVATSGSASSNTINGIIAVRGQAFAKIPIGGTYTINQYLETTNTTGYGQTLSFLTNASNFVYGGATQSTLSTSCSSANTVASACQYAALVDFNPAR